MFINTVLTGIIESATLAIEQAHNDVGLETGLGHMVMEHL
jgi:hypothetical protein